MSVTSLEWRRIKLFFGKKMDCGILNSKMRRKAFGS